MCASLIGDLSKCPGSQLVMYRHDDVADVPSYGMFVGEFPVAAATHSGLEPVRVRTFTTSRPEYVRRLTAQTITKYAQKRSERTVTLTHHRTGTAEVRTRGRQTR